MTNETTTPTLHKEILRPQALTIIGAVGTAASLRFDRRVFLSTASAGLNMLSIMERVRHIADALKAALPANYATALEIIDAMAPRLTHGFRRRHPGVQRPNPRSHKRPLGQHVATVW